jgi:hypothetical protein
VIVGVIVKLPIPVPAAALKNLTAAGAVGAAGTTSGEYATLLLGAVQVLPELHATFGAAAIAEAVVAKV